MEVTNEKEIKIVKTQQFKRRNSWNALQNCTCIRTRI